MHRYTPEQKSYIHEIALGKYNDEITKLFNNRFGTDLTEGQIKSFKAKHKIKSGVPRKRITGDEGLFTKEQKNFIKNNATGKGNEELTRLLNTHFGLNLPVQKIKTFKHNHKISSGLTGRYEKGHIPFNKGKKGLCQGGVETQFKKGHKPHNYVPVGSERVNGDDYVDIKIADPNKWRGKHLIVWEKHHNRPVPKGHAVIFGDGNRRNFNPDNLILVSRGQLAIMNKNGLIQNNAELTRTGVILADIYRKIGERKRNKRGKERK